MPAHQQMMASDLKCILGPILPLSKGIRESRSDFDKAGAMGVFLGVLETDIIEVDVGLSNVDHRSVVRCVHFARASDLIACLLRISPRTYHPL